MKIVDDKRADHLEAESETHDLVETHDLGLNHLRIISLGIKEFGA